MTGAGAPQLSICVIHQGWRGYPERALRSLDAPPGVETEYLLATGAAPWVEAGLEATLGGRRVRVVRPAGDDRAAARNAALRAARGEFVLLVGSDMTAASGAVAELMEVLRQRGGDVVSAQMLNENGLARRSAFVFPSLAREMNPFGWLWRRRHQFLRLEPPTQREPCRAAAVRAQFLLGRRETFRRVGDFAEGYRFAVEELEWCARARRAGVARWVAPGAGAHNLAPQRHGEVPPEHRLAIEASLVRLAGAMRGPAYAAVFRAVRRGKTLVKWGVAAAWNRAVPAHSNLMAAAEPVHRALWRGAGVAQALPADAESHSRWEAII